MTPNEMRTLLAIYAVTVSKSPARQLGMNRLAAEIPRLLEELEATQKAYEELITRNEDLLTRSRELRNYASSLEHVRRRLQDVVQTSPTKDTVQAYQKLLANPPAPWEIFGSNVGESVQLVFWGVDETGTPIWERPEPDDKRVVAASNMAALEAGEDSENKETWWA